VLESPQVGCSLTLVGHKSFCFSMDAFFRYIVERGYVYQQTHNITELGSGPFCGYVGFDCTAPSLHVGNLLQIMLLRTFQSFGHIPKVVLGGATTQIGDPSGKNTMRKTPPIEEVRHNKASLQRVFSRFLNFSQADHDNPIVLDNLDWLEGVGYLNFLKDYGGFFSINRMVGLDFVKTRLENNHPLSLLELNYMVFQAYDFLELKRRHACTIQFGGSDQWGNILNGVDLIHRVTGDTVLGITTPLIMTSSGTKMGKTEQGAIWLNEEMLSPYEYWQFWRNTADADVIKFLMLYTEIPTNEIREMGETTSINDLKTALADEATKLCHGVDAANKAKETAKKIFEEHTTSSGLPRIQLNREALGVNFQVYKIFVLSGLCSSGNAAKSLIKDGGAKFNGVLLSDPLESIQTNNLSDEVVVSLGKKRNYIISLE